MSDNTGQYADNKTAAAVVPEAGPEYEAPRITDWGKAEAAKVPKIMGTIRD